MEKFELGKLIAEMKLEYENECSKKSKLVPHVNGRRSTKPKAGYLSKAIRQYYNDLAKLPSDDKEFKRALAFGKRCHDYYLGGNQDEPPSKKRFKRPGGGRKQVAVDVRMRLFQWFIGK